MLQPLQVTAVIIERFSSESPPETTESKWARQTAEKLKKFKPPEEIIVMKAVAGEWMSRRRSRQ